MKTVVKGAIRNEKGNVFILVLILLVVGGLILTPLLGLMSTGLLAGQVYEKKTDELYAADAGVEDAIWRLQTNNLTFLNNCSEPWHLTVNSKNVTIEVHREDMDPTPCGEDFVYQILSTAVTDDGSGTAAIDSSTTIDAHITTTVTYLSILDHLITIYEKLDEDEVEQLVKDMSKLGIPCPTGCEELGQCEKCGKAYDYTKDDYKNVPQECKGCIAVHNFAEAGWPTADDLSARYLQDVEYATKYYGDTSIDLKGTSCPPGPIYINDEEDNSWLSGLGPLYVDGELTIENSISNNATLILNPTMGTLYITGDTRIGMNGKGGKPNLTLDLNGQTIFVASDSSDPQKALQIGDWCTVMGPGCIIAVGDVYFAPKGDVGSNGKPVLILSVSGTTTLKPSGDFYGAIGGNVNVEAFSGETPTTTYPTGGFGEDINFPSPFEVNRTYTIASWEINPLSPEDLGG